jgi:hypothetical protein
LAPGLHGQRYQRNIYRLKEEYLDDGSGVFHKPQTGRDDFRIVKKEKRMGRKEIRKLIKAMMADFSFLID